MLNPKFTWLLDLYCNFVKKCSEAIKYSSHSQKKGNVKLNKNQCTQIKYYSCIFGNLKC